MLASYRTFQLELVSDCHFSVARDGKTLALSLNNFRLEVILPYLCLCNILKSTFNTRLGSLIQKWPAQTSSGWLRGGGAGLVQRRSIILFDISSLVSVTAANLDSRSAKIRQTTDTKSKSKPGVKAVMHQSMLSNRGCGKGVGWG